MRYCTCANIVANALHRDDGISYSTTLHVPHHTFDPTMHLHSATMCESCPELTPINIYFITEHNVAYIVKHFNIFPPPHPALIFKCPKCPNMELDYLKYTSL